MSTNFTAGPWRVDERLSCWAIICELPSGQKRYPELCFVSRPRADYADNGSVTSQGCSISECLANAHLIAAAPALLELCERSLAFLADPELMQSDLDEIKFTTDLENAISAAKGGA